MNEYTDSLNELVERLRKERDELRLRSNLARMDFHDQWDEVEVKWRHLEEKLQNVGHRTSESTRQLAREIAEAYRRLRDSQEN